MHKLVPLSLLLLACTEGTTDDGGGGMVQVDPPDPNLNEGNNLPLTSEREDLASTAVANLFTQTLCLVNQGFGDHYGFDGYQCFGGRQVLYLRWSTEEGLGTVVGSESFTIAAVNDGVLDGDTVTDLPGYTELVFTGSGTSDVTSITFTFDDGPSIRDVVVE